MTTAAEKLSRLVSDKMAYNLPDSKPAVGQVLTVTAAGIDQVNLGFSSAALPDPIDRFELDPVTNILTLHTVGGATYDIDLSPVLTDTNTFITAVADIAVGEIGITLNDGSSVTYTATLNDPELKADKTTSVVSTSTQLNVTNPTLADDVSLSLSIGTAAGDLVALAGANELPAAIANNLVSSGGFFRLDPAPYDASSGNPPSAGIDGDLAMVTKAGRVSVLPLGNGSPATDHNLVVGDILRKEVGGWRIISRSQIVSLDADQVEIKPAITGLGANAQTGLQALEDRKVPTSRNIVSLDINKLTVNGLVQDDMDADVQLGIVVNAPNGIAGLDTGGRLTMSQMPKEATQYHGYLAATAVDSTADRPTTPPTPWVTGDTLIMSTAGNATVIDIGDTTPSTVALIVGQMIARNAAGDWFVMPTSGRVNSGDVNISPALGGTRLTQVDLNSVLQHIEANAVWITGTQTVAGDKTLTGATTLRDVTIGSVSSEYVLPTARTTTIGQTLISAATGGVVWGDVSANRVTYTPFTGLAATNVQAAIREVHDDALLLTPIGKQTLEGGYSTAATAKYTELNSSVGVIFGDGATANQITNVIFDEGRI